MEQGCHVGRIKRMELCGHQYRLFEAVLADAGGENADDCVLVLYECPEAFGAFFRVYL